MDEIQLVTKMMKQGIPKPGALRLVRELDEEQIRAALNSNDFLMEIINVLYYNRSH